MSYWTLSRYKYHLLLTLRRKAPHGEPVMAIVNTVNFRHLSNLQTSSSWYWYTYCSITSSQYHANYTRSSLMSRGYSSDSHHRAGNCANDICMEELTKPCTGPLGDIDRMPIPKKQRKCEIIGAVHALVYHAKHVCEPTTCTITMGFNRTCWICANSCKWSIKKFQTFEKRRQNTIKWVLSCGYPQD